MMKDDSAILSAVARQVFPAKSPPRKQETKVAASPKDEWSLPGFFGKSKVQTSFGNLPIEALRCRDQLKTITGGYVRVEWVDQLKLDMRFLKLHPEAQPVYIPKNTIGPAMPNQNMLVSPAQSLRTSGRIGDDALHLALALTGRPHISRMPHTGFTYYMFHCGAPAVVNVDGVWVGTSPE
jgi:hypothetical protein